MANQRKAGKKKVQLWMTEEERKLIEEKAAKKGMTVTEFLKWIASLPLIIVAFLWFAIPSTRPAIRSAGTALLGLVQDAPEKPVKSTKTKTAKAK